ncbi:hypothetical protein FIBSPDRAFT_885776 [Athelia psychrophila]|uniref:Uncharacterized protein n=1 Tax=Athelia psychrophila TaxID=1759441 RepID=A0A166RQH6_9AGAM|nr:hypothetical protein FIBSPDRAFT_885776 [Fibularhizoctonia sp. CBS 109695]
MFHLKEKAANLQVAARIFPGVERLTCQAGTSPHQNPLIYDTHHIITQIALAIELRKGEDTSTSHYGLCWHKLHTLAVEGSDNRGRSQVTVVHHEISVLQEAGHPIRKIKVPKAALVQVDAEAAVDLREIVEMGEFWLDWPTPFE